MKDNTSKGTLYEKNTGGSGKAKKNPTQRILEFFCAIFMGGIVVLLSAQVAVRHLGGSSLPWSGEMATWLFSWSTFAGAVLVYMEKKHIVIDFLITFLSPKPLKILNYFQQVIIAVVLIILVVTGIKITMLISDQTATSIDLSKGFLFAALPISSVLMIGWTVYSWVKGRHK